MSNKLMIVGLVVVGFVAIALTGCSKPAKPSALISDAELLRKFNSEALPTNYHVLARTTGWKSDGVKGRFERSFASTVLEMDNAAVDPQIVLFQVGYRNRFRHPKQQILERYQALGSTNLRSDTDGAILLKFGDTVSVDTYRSQHRRYWYGR